MRGTITFNKEVTYLSSISNETLQVISGNSSFVENAARALQETAVQLPVSLMGFGERTINFRTFFNESLFFSNVSIRIVNSTQYIRAADTNRPVEQPHGVFAVPLYNFYQPSDRAIGQEFRLMSESITVVMLLLGLLMVLRNRLSEMYFILHYMQHLYLLIFLNLLYPPNLGSFLAGFKLAHLSFVPNLFGNVIPPGYRQNSPLPFFVNSYDISFIRSAGFDFTIVVGVLLFFIVCRLLEALFTAVAEKALPEALGPTAHENVTPQIEKEPEQTAVVVRDGPEEGQQEDEGRAEVA